MARRPPPVVVDQSDTRWHVDRKIPLALILTIIVQTGGVVWWGASISARIDVLEKRADSAAPQGDRLTRVEVRLDAVQEGITEIKSILRREPLPPAKIR